MTVCHRRKSPLWYLRGVLLIPSSTHIFQWNVIISSACHRSSSLHLSPGHYSSMVLVVRDSIYALYRTLPLRAQSNQGGYFLQFKIGYVLQCDGATSLSLSKDSFIKFRGQRVLKCWSMCTTLTENLTLFSGNCPLWEHIKRNNGSSVLWWNPVVL